MVLKSKNQFSSFYYILIFYLIIFQYPYIYFIYDFKRGFPGGSVVKNPPANAGDTDLIPGLGRSPGGGNSNQFQYQFSSVQSLSRVRPFATPWIAARQASLSITNFWSSLKFTSIESVMLSSHLILCRPLLLLTPISPSIDRKSTRLNSSHLA